MAIALTPGQTMALTGVRGKPAQVRMGLGWTSTRSRVDLDASALLYSAEGRLLDQVWYGQLASKDGSVRHSGDNVTGQGEGDLESIRVDLSRLPEAVTTLVFTVNSFTGQRFSKVTAASCRLVDETYGDEELGSFNLSASGPHTAQIMAKLSRNGTAWTMTAIGSPAGGQIYKDLLSAVAEYLGVPAALSTEERERGRAATLFAAAIAALKSRRRPE
ncbi:TerD family protein [Phytohabitans aurantiacus]|uniref:Tellurium resistance protein TerZ n=1 Tax=Phytohabitans aurantiacus TaxID=3016789 RepID=A0ABQ5R2M4_9ACTN|nr:TerD family protein [Phytohabitans aurantiacus]GLI00583.1 tellurium resistance protein TerZ [Phytohabitans aurantiacus]